MRANRLGFNIRVLRRDAGDPYLLRLRGSPNGKILVLFKLRSWAVRLYTPKT